MDEPPPPWLTEADALRMIVEAEPGGAEALARFPMTAGFLIQAAAIARAAGYPAEDGLAARTMFYRAQDTLQNARRKGSLPAKGVDMGVEPGGDMGGRLRDIDPAEWIAGTASRCRNIVYSRDALARLLARHDHPPQAKPDPGAKPNTGRKPLPIWQRLEAERDRLFAHHGDFIAGDPEWNAQARLEEALFAYCRAHDLDEPSLSALRRKIAAWAGRN